MTILSSSSLSFDEASKTINLFFSTLKLRKQLKKDLKAQNNSISSPPCSRLGFSTKNQGKNQLFDLAPDNQLSYTVYNNSKTLTFQVNYNSAI